MTRPRYHAAIADGPGGQMVLAIAHRGANGRPQLDHVKDLTVTGGQAGIAAVYRGLQANGITVTPAPPWVPRACSDARPGDDARERAVCRVLASAAGEPAG